jgi:hypothetical protein
MSEAEASSAMADMEATLEQKPRGCLFGVMVSGMVCEWPRPWERWPSPEAFMLHARSRGMASAVQKRLAGWDWFGSALAFPDGTMAEFGGSRRWPSLLAFEKARAGRAFWLVRRRPVPEAPARMQG